MRIRDWSSDVCSSDLENGAKAVAAEATKHRATPELFARHAVAELARYSDHWLEDQGRLTHPMRLDAASGHYVPVSWDEAFALIASHLNALASPDAAIFYTSGQIGRASCRERVCQYV